MRFREIYEGVMRNGYDEKARVEGYITDFVCRHHSKGDFHEFDLGKLSSSAIWGKGIYCTLEAGNLWKPAGEDFGKVLEGYVHGPILDGTKGIEEDDREKLSKFMGRDLDSLPIIGLEKRYGSLVEGLNACGYCGYVHLVGGKKHIVIFRSWMFKLRGITYGDNGEEIRLEERYDVNKEDIRY